MIDKQTINDMNKYRIPTPLTNESEILASYVRAIEIMESYGLQNVTTKRHEKNGTLHFSDPQTRATYAIYANGAVRRLFTAYSPYRLNRSVSVKNGNYRDKRYIEHPNNYALLAEMIGNAVKKYRTREYVR